MKTFIFEIKTEGYEAVAVNAETEEEARRLLGDGWGEVVNSEVDWIDSAHTAYLMDTYGGEDD